jgi:hypothetical protein
LSKGHISANEERIKYLNNLKEETQKDNDYKEKLTNTKAELKNEEKKYNSLQDKLKKNEDKIRNIESQIKTEEGAYSKSKLEDSLKNLKLDQEMITGKITKSKKDINNTKEWQKTLESRKGKHNQDIKRYQESIKKLEKENKNMQEKNRGGATTAPVTTSPTQEDMHGTLEKESVEEFTHPEEQSLYNASAKEESFTIERVLTQEEKFKSWKDELDNKNNGKGPKLTDKQKLYRQITINEYLIRSFPRGATDPSLLDIELTKEERQQSGCTLCKTTEDLYLYKKKSTEMGSSRHIDKTYEKLIEIKKQRKGGENSIQSERFETIKTMARIKKENGEYSQDEIGKMINKNIKQKEYSLLLEMIQIFAANFLMPKSQAISNAKDKAKDDFKGKGGGVFSLLGIDVIGFAKNWAMKIIMNTSILKPISLSLQKLMQKAYMTAIISGIAARTNFKLASSAKKEKEQALKNAEALKGVLSGFDSDAKGFCVEGRENPKNANCYCKLEDGSMNPNRTKSATCQRIRDEKNKIYKVGKADYQRKRFKGQNLYCKDRKKGFDPKCECIEKKSCERVSIPRYNSPGMTSALAALPLSTVNDVLNQGLQGSLSSDSRGLNVAINRARKVQEKLLKKLNRKRAKAGKIPIALNNKFAKAVFGKMPFKKAFQKIASSPSSRRRNNSDFSPANPAMKKAMALASKSGVSFKGGKGSFGQRNNKSNSSGDQFDFEGISSGQRNGETVEFDTKDDDYEYEEMSINKDSSESIFNIISHRYLKSGLNRLFGD